MTRTFIAASTVALIVAAPAQARPLFVPPRASDAHLPRLPPLQGADLGPGTVEQYGEIVILEGDGDLVTDDGSGGVGIVYDQFIQNPPAIAKRLFSAYDDLFDEIIVYTSFADDGSPGSVAYEIGVQNDVDGLGQKLFDDTLAWGSGSAALHGFVNMKAVTQYPKLDGLAITDPASYHYSVLGQEFAHRWLAEMLYTDGSGKKSPAMLGRQMAHWASTLQANGSVMDGQRWVDNGDGTFTDVESTDRYSPLDLYGMGLLPMEQVPPWFRIAGAVDNRTGAPVDPTLLAGVGAVFQGTREDISIDQVISANGARNPPFGAAPRQFRVAFVLVTRPGERAADVVALAVQLEQVRKVWEAKFATYSDGNGVVCTQVSAPCGSPVARIVGGTIREGAGANGNGVVEPGEPIDVDFRLTNDGAGAATDVVLAASAQGVTFPAATTLPQLHAGDTVDAIVSGTVSADGALCGQLLTVDGEAQSGGHHWRGFAQTVVGLGDAYFQNFDRGGGYWGADLDDSDTALDGSWAWGVPERYGFGNYFSVQPDGGHGGGGACWFTDLARGNLATGDFHALSVGRATLRSPPIDLSRAISPSLRYYAWFVALDLSHPHQAPTTADEDHLILEATNDGFSWVMLDQVDGAEDDWRRRDLALDGIRLDQPVQFRFTLNRDGAQELVEAGVDDFEILTDLPSCSGRSDGPDMGQAPPPQSGCTLGRSKPMGTGLPLLALLVATWAASRRRRSPTARPFRGGSRDAFPRR